MGVRKKPTINLDMVYDGVKAQARMVNEAYTEYGKALHEYYGCMFIDPSDGSLNVSEDFGRKLNDKFNEVLGQQKRFYELFDEYKRLKAEQLGE